MSHLLEVRIENVYPDAVYVADNWPDAMVVENDQVKKAKRHIDVSHIVSVTLEIEVPDLPPYNASDEDWDEWAMDMIFPFTGIGKTDGDAGYFAEITDVLPEEGYTVDRAEFAHVIGRTFEWGT